MKKEREMRSIRSNSSRLTTRRQILKGAAALGATGVFAGMDSVAGRDRGRPNILFLLADDLRFDGVGYVNKTSIPQT